MYGPIAQLVEQLAFNQWVAGSSPARLTTFRKQTLDAVGCEARRILSYSTLHLLHINLYGRSSLILVGTSSKTDLVSSR